MVQHASKTGILALNFGEPDTPALDRVVPFLERIFLANARLEPHESEEDRRRRSRELAERRAPGLVEEYEAIGGSPLNGQADAQARALAAALAERGHDVHVYSAFQFTEPLVAGVVERMRDEGIQRLVGLPVYPLCGQSTNVAALDDVQAALDALGWAPELRGITGWHRHPGYLELRVDAVRRTVDEAGVSFDDPRTKLVFSAHGTPRRYLDEGSGYGRYVEEFCRDLAARLGVDDYAIGYQNHANRGVEWTQPDVERVIEEIDADTVVVDPVSFMHEQSETLAELDRELREEAEGRALTFHRVPVPHDDPRFADVLADLVEPFLSNPGLETLSVRPGGAPELPYAPCRCRPRDGTFCLNAGPRKVS